MIFGGYFSLFCRYELNVYLFTFFFKHTVVSKTVGLLPAFHLPVYLQNDPFASFSTNANSRPLPFLDACLFSKMTQYMKIKLPTPRPRSHSANPSLRLAHPLLQSWRISWRLVSFIPVILLWWLCHPRLSAIPVCNFLDTITRVHSHPIIPASQLSASKIPGSSLQSERHRKDAQRQHGEHHTKDYLSCAEG